MKVLLAKCSNIFRQMFIMLFRQIIRTTVRADARMGRIGVFLIPGMVTMWSELGPAGPKIANQHLANYFHLAKND